MKINNPNEIKFPFIVNNELDEIKVKRRLKLNNYIIGYSFLNGKDNKYPYELTIGIGKTLVKEIL